MRSYSRTRRLYLPRGAKEDSWPRRPDTTGSSSRATVCPCASPSRATGSTCSGARAGCRRRSERCVATRPGSAGRVPSFRQALEKRVRRRLAKDNLFPGLPLRRRGGGLLRARLQRHALAALPLLPGSAAHHAGGVGAVRPGQRALRGHDPRALRAGRTGVGARLPPDARPGDAAPPRARALDRVLPPHPVPVVRGVPPAPASASSCCAEFSVPTTSASRSATTRATSGRRACAFSASTPSPTGWSSTGGACRDRRRPDRDRRLRLSRGASRTPRRPVSSPISSGQYEGRRLVLGVERLDYTKGIPQKLQAFERFLEQDPERALTTTMIQVLVPSRLESPEYRAQRDEIELLIVSDQRPLRATGHRRRSSTCTATSPSPRSSRSTGEPT